MRSKGFAATSKKSTVCNDKLIRQQRRRRAARPHSRPHAGRGTARRGAPVSEPSQFRLLTERRFGPFFGVQFLGAMNDNVFKQALVILLAYQTAAFTTQSSDVLQNVAQALFIAPFLLFSATAGQLADKYEKRNLVTLVVAL